jgi:hypothetical protein
MGINPSTLALSPDLASLTVKVRFAFNSLVNAHDSDFIREKFKGSTTARIVV